MRGLAGRDFRLLLAVTLGTFANYAPLLSVVPLWAVEGGSGNSAAGAATGVTMAATVAVQLCMGRLLRRLTLRRLLACGALVLGLPTFAYAASSGPAWVLGISAIRGLGFGVVAVAGSALVAELVPAGQRGRAVGWYGVAVGLPQVALLPLGVWAAGHFGFAPVFVVTGALCVLAAPLVLAMPEPGPEQEQQPDRETVAEEDSVAGRRRWGSLAAPWALLVCAACALGGVTSFLPLVLKAPGAAPAALFTVSAVIVTSRWAAGVWSDRHGAGGLLVPGVAACALGMAGLAAATGTEAPAVAASLAAACYGLGFGALQNETLVVMFRVAGPGGHGTASTAWNMAYDGGVGAGALGLGLLSQPLGLPAAFLASALLIAATLPAAGLRSLRHGGAG